MYKISVYKLSTMVYICNSSTHKAGQNTLQEFEAILSCIVGSRSVWTTE